MPSALTKAMRKKFRSPKEAILALGLDESVLAMDAKEKPAMPTQFASTAALLVGTALRPMLKPKAKLDLMPVFKDLTTDSFDANEFRGALDEALKGKLVKGADIKLAYDNFMPHVEGMAKGVDESVSEPQHNAMEAAAHGNSTLGIPQAVGKEFAEADKGKKFGGGDNYDAIYKKAMDFMRAKGMDVLPEEFMEHMGKPAQDEEEEPEEVTQGFKNIEQHGEDRRARDARMGRDRRADDKRADDRRADDRRADDRRADDRRADDRRADDDDNRADDKSHAMDEAGIEKRITEKLKAKFGAAETARKYVGQLDPMAFDSAEDIYRHVFKARGYKRWKEVHPDAFQDILATIPQIGARPVERMAADSKFGFDETRRADAVKLAPGLAHIRIGV